MRLRELRIGEKVPGVAGGTWLGRILPPLTEFMVLTDREDGTRWLLTHTVTEEGRDYFTITDTFATRKQPFVEYGPYDGPFVPDHPTLRVFIRGGRLGYEELTTRNQSQRILSRKLMQRHTLEVFAGSSYKRAGDVLSCRRIDF